MTNHNNDTPIPLSEVDQGLLEKCRCTVPTLHSWMRKYDVVMENGQIVPLGKKVGGQWRTWPDRLERFLAGHCLPIMGG